MRLKMITPPIAMLARGELKGNGRCHREVVEKRDLIACAKPGGTRRIAERWIIELRKVGETWERIFEEV
jgi:hypothetical protein